MTLALTGNFSTRILEFCYRGIAAMQDNFGASSSILFCTAVRFAGRLNYRLVVPYQSQTSRKAQYSECQNMHMCCDLKGTGGAILT
jgi:hypothetical protein